MFITPMTPIARLNEANQVKEAPKAGEAEQIFRGIVDAVIGNMRETEIVSSNNSALLALGEIDDLHTIGIDATKAFLATRLVVELRNRATEAYSEIMRISM